MQIQPNSAMGNSQPLKATNVAPLPEYDKFKESEHYKESIKHYQDLLAKAKPFPPDVLTVNRINSLQKKNTASITFLSGLYETIKEDSEKDLCVGFKSTLQNYLFKMQKFAEEFKQL